MQRRRYARIQASGATRTPRVAGCSSHGGIEPSARELVTTAMETLKLSARGYHRVLRVARTIADLGGSDVVAEPHVAEALRFRPR